MKKVFDTIHALVPDMDGWCTVEKASTLASIVIALRPTITVEIGVFGGRSFVPMALAHQAINRGTAFAIDPWSKEASLEGMEGEHREWWATAVDHDDIHARFMKRLEQFALRDCTVVLRARSRDVPTDMFPFIDLLHIDGNHSDEASCADITRFAPLVREGGILVMDDVEWAVKATALIAGYNFELLYRIDKWCVYQRSKLPVLAVL